MSNVFSEPMALRMAIATVVPRTPGHTMERMIRKSPAPSMRAASMDLVLDLADRGVVEHEDDAGGLPDLDRDHDDQGDGPVGEPRLSERVQADRPQDSVQRPVRCVDLPEDGCGGRGREHHGDEDQDLVQGLEVQLRVQQAGKDDAKGHLHHEGHHEEDHGVGERPPEHRIAAPSGHSWRIRRSPAAGAAPSHSSVEMYPV